MTKKLEKRRKLLAEAEAELLAEAERLAEENTKDNHLKFPGFKIGSPMWNFILSNDQYSEAYLALNQVELIGQSGRVYILKSVSEVEFCRDSTEPAHPPNTKWSDDTNLIARVSKDRLDGVRKLKKHKVMSFSPDPNIVECDIGRIRPYPTRTKPKQHLLHAEHRRLVQELKDIATRNAV